MTQEGFKRKLTAILSADVAGYSRLMADDEAATVKTLATYREVMASLIKQHRGRVVDSPGDNVLAEFPSVVDAVQCAVAVQKEFQSRNAALPENRRMEFRIGINLGDVIEEEDRIYGDGVNIAARLESLADPGGICVSKTAFDHIETKLPLGYEYLGEQELKNIPKPVGVYKVVMEPRVTVADRIEKKKALPIWRRKAILSGGVALIVLIIAAVIWNFYFRLPPIEPASVERMAFPLPEKPSIAVLPFINMSGDPEQEYFSDGLSEEIITALSKTPQMFVIARNSTFSYKGKQVKVQQVAEELGVRYVLEGSVRKSEDRLRITAQLIDAITGRHLWAERYDRDLKDIFALQDEITLKILHALRLKLTDGVYASVTEKGTNNLEAYLKLLQAREYGLRGTKEGNAMQRKLSEEVITLDPNYPMAYLSLSATHLKDLLYGTSKSPIQSLKLAEELVQKALTLNKDSAWGHAFLGRIYLTKRQYEKAITQGERALALDPNSDFAQAALAFTLRNAGRHEEAIALFKKAIRLNPIPPPWYLFSCGFSHFILSQYQEATVAFKKVLQRSPENLFAHVGLAATYSVLGREKDAHAEAEEIIRIDPTFTLETLAKGFLLKNQADIDRTIEALRKAGLPEMPPLPLPDKPSIAVLPFVNMSEDPKQEYFSDGITEDLITDLSKISGLFVIARNSVFQYKSKIVDVKKISSELGVRYLLEGSVRRAEDKVRINAQLIDATTGGHLWAERYDGIMLDIFALQDRITRNIVATLAVKLTGGEEAHVSHKETINVAAYDTFLQGWAHYVRLTPDDYAKAIPYFEKAINLDPHYGRAYAALASIYWESFYRFWHASLGVAWRETKERADEYLKKAMENPTPLGYLVASKMLISSFEHEKAIDKAEQSIALDPNDANGYLAKTYTLVYAGRPKEAFGFIQKAMRLNPQYPAYYLFVLGLAHFGMDQFEEAATSFERAIKRNPENYVPLIPLAAAYAHLNRKQDAIDTIEKLRKVLPMVTISFVRACPLWRYKNPRDKKRLLDGLRKAGLPSSIYETLRKTG